MSDPQASPAAAIFWIWHAYVDELYWEYELCAAKYASVPYNQNFNSGKDYFTYLGSSNRFGNIMVTTANSPRSGSHLTMDVNTNNNYAANEAIINLNLAGMSNVSLSFYWKEWSEEPHDQDGVYFSDGGPFVKVYSLTGASSSYPSNPTTLSVSTLAANNGLSLTNTFKIKFQQYDNYAITTDGMAFDDISVSGTMASGHCNLFESGWDWWFDRTDDDINWRRYKGSTPSTNTGPTSAASGDYYIYLEASGNPSSTAILQRQVYNGALNSVSFNYHMYGSTMGTLAFQVSNSATTGYTTLWTANGNQSNIWRSATITIPSSYLSSGYYLRFVGTTGSSWSSDMALDNICFSSTSRATDDEVVVDERTQEMRGYPNPFSQSTTIEYTLTEATEVVLTVTDVTGREIKKLVNGASQQPGVHQVIFNAENIPDGVYLYTLDAQGTRKTGKLILQR